MPAYQFNHIPQQPVKIELDKTPLLQETLKDTEQLTSGTATGIDPLGIWRKRRTSTQYETPRIIRLPLGTGKTPTRYM